MILKKNASYHYSHVSRKLRNGRFSHLINMAQPMDHSVEIFMQKPLNIPAKGFNSSSF